MYRVTGLDRAASVTEAMSAHRREYLMERTELGAFMFSTCICGTLIYSDGSPFKSLALSRVFDSVLIGTAMAITTFLIIRSPRFTPGFLVSFSACSTKHETRPSVD